MSPEFERAAIAGDVRGIESELQRGAEIDSRDSHRQTALMLVAHNGHLEAVELLVRHRAGADAYDLASGQNMKELSSEIAIEVAKSCQRNC